MKSYYVNKNKMLPLIEREVSRVAASAYSEEGVPLYDAIRITSRDEDTLKDMIDDAMTAMLTKLSDITTLSSGFFEFDIPEERTHDIMTIGKAIDRFIVMNVCAAWMLQKYSAKAEEYGARSTDAINKVERLLQEKLPPIPPKHKDQNEEENDNITQG
jgi:hypothetical protein